MTPMSIFKCLGLGLVLFASSLSASSLYAATPAAHALSMAEILAKSGPGDWRVVEDANTLYVDLPAGRVIIELAPSYAPHHSNNVKALAREGYYDGLSILRSQDNYVVQWGDPDGKRPVNTAKRTLAAEFERTIDADIAFTRLPDPDTYAPQVGFSNGFPVAWDPKRRSTWLVHCYGMVGAGRDNAADSGGGTELYVVDGHAPRHLDRNVTLVGRVLRGMELLSSLPRGRGEMGFYESAAERVPLQRVRLASDVAATERVALEVLRTDTPTFAALIEARRNRPEEWFKVAAGHIELCNVPLPVRAVTKAERDLPAADTTHR
jgi:peptidylprolyl isomerase